VGSRGAAESIRRHQRRRYDELWRAGRARALSPDLIRQRVWKPHLVEPVLDVGAGDGLLARCFPTLAVISLDQSTTGLAHAPAPKLVGELEHLPIRSASMATIVAAEVLEHVGDPLKALTECRRIIRPSGVLLISVPMLPLSFSEELFHRWRTGVRPSAENLPTWDPEHERRYERVRLLEQLRQTGWDPVQEVPLFGSVTGGLFYFVEPLLYRVRRRSVRVAQFGVTFDRLISRWDRPSDLVVICRPGATATTTALPLD